LSFLIESSKSLSQNHYCLTTLQLLMCCYCTATVLPLCRLLLKHSTSLLLTPARAPPRNFRSALLPQAQECTLPPPPHPVKSLVRCLRYCFQSLHSATASFDQSRFAGQVDCSTLSTIIQTACNSVFVACFAHRSACRVHLIRLHLA
jgi:hypothetical protein